MYGVLDDSNTQNQSFLGTTHLQTNTYILLIHLPSNCILLGQCNVMYYSNGHISLLLFLIYINEKLVYWASGNTIITVCSERNHYLLNSCQNILTPRSGFNKILIMNTIYQRGICFSQLALTFLLEMVLEGSGNRWKIQKTWFSMYDIDLKQEPRQSVCLVRQIYHLWIWLVSPVVNDY